MNGPPKNATCQSGINFNLNLNVSVGIGEDRPAS
jgi:hypothetical protein